MEKKTESLLVEIQAAAQCRYLSDLHSTDALFALKAKQRVLEIADDRYTAAAWSEAVSYIMVEACTYATVSEAKAAIVAGKKRSGGRRN